MHNTAKLLEGHNLEPSSLNKVLAQNDRGGEGKKWLPGTIISVLSPATYLVDVNGKVCKRHVNQMLQTEI